MAINYTMVSSTQNQYRNISATYFGHDQFTIRLYPGLFNILLDNGDAKHYYGNVIEIFFDILYDSLGFDSNLINDEWNRYTTNAHKYPLTIVNGTNEKPITWINPVHITTPELINQKYRVGGPLRSAAEKAVTYWTPDKDHINYNPALDNYTVCIHRFG